MQVGRADAADAFALAALELQRARELGRPGEPGFIDKYADFWLREREHRPAWVAKSLDGKALGSVVLYHRFELPSPGLRPRPVATVDSLYVTKNARHGGTGEKLLRAALFWASQNDVTVLRGQATPEAIPLLTRLGFESEGDMAVAVRMR